jgi:hypothetical protein
VTLALMAGLAVPAAAQDGPRDLRLVTLEELMSIEVTSLARREQRAQDVAAAVSVRGFNSLCSNVLLGGVPHMKLLTRYEWPNDSGAPGVLTLCVLDDGAVEGALTGLVDTGPINGRAVNVSRDAILHELQRVPVLTVSNGDDFVRTGGIIGLFVEEGRMRFAVSPDAAQRAGVRLSSRLLQLAKIHRDDLP